MMSAEKCQLLLAVNDILSIVKVQDNNGRLFGVGVTKMVQKSNSHAVEFRTGDHVLKPAERGLAGKIKAAVRQTLKGHLQGWILAQGVAVIGILVTAGNLVDSLRQERWNSMGD